MNSKLDNRFFPLIFDSIACGIFTTSSDGKITSFNRMAEELTGYRRDEVIGKECQKIFRTDRCHSNCPLQSSIDTGRTSGDQEVKITTRDGKMIPVAISTAALIDEANNIVGGVEMFRDLRLVTELRKRLMKSYVFEDIISKNHRMIQIFELIPLVANSASTVLIEGDSGTGKELVARAIHNLGPRKDKPFIPVNCSALPDNLLESELFGYKKGAFTDAKHDKPGRFAAAEGGTLLLDEIGELGKPMQVKLLRVLQEKVYEPLGSTTPIKADVRIIASTNRDLPQRVKEHKFRKDLFYRLNVVSVTLPTLQDRKEDIPLLVNHFIERFNALQGRRIKRCSERVMSLLMRFPFPGNIRELENAIEHAFVICICNTIQASDLPSHIQEYEPENDKNSQNEIMPLEEAEADTIRAVLERNGYNRTNTAHELGISRNTLWRKMKKYHISPPLESSLQG
jgi:PAS domain S-box-containing protein